MEKATYNEMTKTSRVDNEDGTFDTYTPAQYAEKFGAVPAEVEDVTDIEEEVLDNDSSAGSEDDEETVTSVDGTVTVPVSEIEAGLKAFENLSPEEQAKVKADQEAAEVAHVGVDLAAEGQDTTVVETLDVPAQTGQLSTNSPVSTSGVVNEDYSGPGNQS